MSLWLAFNTGSGQIVGINPTICPELGLAQLTATINRNNTAR